MNEICSINVQQFDTEFLSSLYELQQNGFLCDTTICTATGMIYAHKCVLAASSVYFWEVEKGRMRCEPSVYHLTHVNHEAMGLVIKLLYTGRVFASTQHVQEVENLCAFFKLRWKVFINNNEEIEKVTQDRFGQPGQHNSSLNLDFSNNTHVYDIATQHQQSLRNGSFGTFNTGEVAFKSNIVTNCVSDRSNTTQNNFQTQLQGNVLGEDSNSSSAINEYYPNDYTSDFSNTNIRNKSDTSIENKVNNKDFLMTSNIFKETHSEIIDEVAEGDARKFKSVQCENKTYKSSSESESESEIPRTLSVTIPGKKKTLSKDDVKCPEFKCQQQFDTHDKLLEHFEDSPAHMAHPPHCLTCKETFWHRDKLEHHRKEIHPPKLRQFPCSICGRPHKRFFIMIDHMSIVHDVPYQEHFKIHKCSFPVSIDFSMYF